MRAIRNAAVSEATPKMQNDHSKRRVAKSGAASAGPSTRVRLLAADCSETALGRSRGGTAFAATAKLAGPAKQKAVPSRKESASASGGPIAPAAVSSASASISVETA